jgi:peptide-methionine (S)-S-oxide reductase
MAKPQVATLAGGCFWCLEAVFRDLLGVISVESGFMGGQVACPTYEQVCTGTTGHAEAVQIRFDPEITPYRELLEIFFAIHDPTTLNCQGGDAGTQYRSAIFYHSPEQERTAREVIFELFDHLVFHQPIVTEIVPAVEFYRAEEYHQEYFRRNPSQPYCAVVVSPKLQKFRKNFAHKLRPGFPIA